MSEPERSGFRIVAATALLGIIGGASLYAQGQGNDKFELDASLGRELRRRDESNCCPPIWRP